MCRSVTRPLIGSPLFINGVKDTYWGWAPAFGPFYYGLIVYLNTFLIWGLVHLARGYRREESSFRRNRGQLILLGTSVSLAGGMIDIFRFVLAGAWPAAERIYPVGIPANAIFALLLGTSIVRYRLFDVSVFVKRAVVYGVVAAVAAAVGRPELRDGHLLGGGKPLIQPPRRLPRGPPHGQDVDVRIGDRHLIAEVRELGGGARGDGVDERHPTRSRRRRFDVRRGALDDRAQRAERITRCERAAQRIGQFPLALAALAHVAPQLGRHGVPLHRAHQPAVVNAQRPLDRSRTRG